MNHPTVYLAGHISGITYDEATEWRHRAAEQLRRDNAVVSLDPMRGKECLRAHYGDQQYGGQQQARQEKPRS